MVAPASQYQSLLKKVFVSPDEPRLRAGWRLLIHGALTITLLLLTTLPLGVVVVIAILLQPGTSPLESPTVLLVGTLLSALAITLSTWLARRFLDRRSFGSLGLNIDRSTIPDLVFGFVLTALIMGLIYLVELEMGWLDFEGWSWESGTLMNTLAALLSALILYVFVGYQEELLFRGYELQNLAQGLDLPWGVLLSSAIFGLLHLGNPNATWASAAGILVAGYFLAYGWLRTRRLWLPIGLHIGWNFFEGTVFGFPVSGTGGFNLIHQTVQGPVLFTGGAFGPEAGLIILPGMALGALLIWVYTRARRRLLG